MNRLAHPIFFPGQGAGGHASSLAPARRRGARPSVAAAIAIEVQAYLLRLGGLAYAEAFRVAASSSDVSRRPGCAPERATYSAIVGA